MNLVINRRFLLICLAVMVLARLAALPIYPLLDSSEGRYSLIPLTMVESGNWVTPSFAPGDPYLAKPPLSFWITAVSFSLFGASEFAARLPALLMIGASAFLVWLMALARGRDFALAAAAIFASMGYVNFLAGTVLPDISFALSIALAMVSFHKALNGKGRLWGYAFFVGAAASLLIKGPVGGVLIGLPLTIYLTWQGRWGDCFRRLPWLTGVPLALLIVIPWYALAERAYPGFLDYFLVGEHYQRYTNPRWPDRYGHGIVTPMGTIWPFALAAAAPWSLLALWDLLFKSRRQAALAPEFRQDDWLRYLVVWAVAQLLFFSIPRHVLITYAAPALPAIALLVAHVLWRSWGERSRAVLLACFVIGPAAVLGFSLFAHFKADSPALRTQKPVLALKAKTAPGDAAPIFYTPEIPFSASFYNRKGVAVAANWTAIGERAAREPIWAAVSRARVKAVPADVMARFTEVGRANDYLLLKANAPK